MGGIIPVSSWE